MPHSLQMIMPNVYNISVSHLNRKVQQTLLKAIAIIIDAVIINLPIKYEENKDKLPSSINFNARVYYHRFAGTASQLS